MNWTAFSFSSFSNVCTLVTVGLYINLKYQTRMQNCTQEFHLRMQRWVLLMFLAKACNIKFICIRGQESICVICMHVLWSISVTALFAHPGYRCRDASFALSQNVFVIEQELKLYWFKASLIFRITFICISGLYTWASSYWIALNALKCFCGWVVFIWWFFFGFFLSSLSCSKFACIWNDNPSHVGEFNSVLFPFAPWTDVIMLPNHSERETLVSKWHEVCKWK